MTINKGKGFKPHAKMYCDSAYKRISNFSSPGLQFNRSNIAREFNDIALLLNRKYPQIFAGKNKSGCEINECRKPRLVEVKLVIWSAGQKLTSTSCHVSELSISGGLASVQDISSTDFYPNSILLKYSWPLLSELIY